MTNKFLALISLCFVFTACSSSGPATQYYALFPIVSADEKTPVTNIDSLGIGPVNLAGYLENPAIVSRSKASKVNVSGYSAWAEPLNVALARVIAGDLSEMSDIAPISAFPWDTRARPNYQLILDIDQFDGQRGDTVYLTLRWILFSTKDNKVIKQGREKYEQPSSGKEYGDYTHDLNLLLHKASEDFVEKLRNLEN